MGWEKNFGSGAKVWVRSEILGQEQNFGLRFKQREIWSSLELSEAKVIRLIWVIMPIKVIRLIRLIRVNRLIRVIRPIT